MTFTEIYGSIGFTSLRLTKASTLPSYNAR